MGQTSTCGLVQTTSHRNQIDYDCPVCGYSTTIQASDMHGPDCGRGASAPVPHPTPERDEPRIRANLTRYLDALGEFNHHQWQVNCAKENMAAALRDLRAAGGHAEAERYTNAR